MSYFGINLTQPQILVLEAIHEDRFPGFKSSRATLGSLFKHQMVRLSSHEVSDATMFNKLALIEPSKVILTELGSLVMVEIYRKRLFANLPQETLMALGTLAQYKPTPCADSTYEAILDAFATASLKLQLKTRRITFACARVKFPSWYAPKVSRYFRTTFGLI